jgi:Ca2+-binding RTX toxin-like protein
MGTMVKRVVFLGLTALLGAFLIGGVAFAITETGTNGNDELIGTNKEDKLSGRGGDDYLEGRAAADTLKGGSDEDQIRGMKGRDYLSGGRGKDILLGGNGSDRIEADDGYRDSINCGKGLDDKANVDDKDSVENCEFVDGQPVDEQEVANEG